MTTAIGYNLDPPYRLSLAWAVGLVVVVGDMLLVYFYLPWAYSNWRAVPALGAMIIYLLLARGDRNSLGLTARVKPSWWWWCRAALYFALAIIGFGGVVYLVSLLLGFRPPIYRVDPSHLGFMFVHMCVYAPLVEEMIYRLVLCVPVAAMWRPAPAILLCGAVFSLLHVVYGNPGPDNLIAGFFLTWAYLKSESLLLPLVLHSVGNLCALLAQLASWYLFPAT